MTERCERCGKIPLVIYIINPHNESGFSEKRTVLCGKCRALWHMAFMIINHDSLVVNVKETKKAWKKFMADGRERVEFT